MKKSKAQILQLNGQNANNDRRELDFYPTPADVTIALMDFLALRWSTIWEPACGDGSMSRVLELYENSVLSTDIRFTGYGDGGVNFLETVKPVDAIITNPPFNISDRFIVHAVEQCPIVALLLKSQYWHAKKKVADFRPISSCIHFTTHLATRFSCWGKGWKSDNGVYLDCLDRGKHLSNLSTTFKTNRQRISARESIKGF